MLVYENGGRSGNIPARNGENMQTRVKAERSATGGRKCGRVARWSCALRALCFFPLKWIFLQYPALTLVSMLIFELCILAIGCGWGGRMD